MSKCAACGRGGRLTKTCQVCREVKYCNEACRKSHRRKHEEEECDEHIPFDEIVDAMSDTTISDEELFKTPPAKRECPICLLPMPFYLTEGSSIRAAYMRCCGRNICGGCCYGANKEIAAGNINDCCPFCRAKLNVSNEEKMQRYERRVAAGDAEALFRLGCAHSNGDVGLPKNGKKALRLWIRAAELGSVPGHFSVSCSYYLATEVERDMKKSVHHLKHAAMGGHERARHSLGSFEDSMGRKDRAMKHFMLSACAGYEDSLKEIGKGYRGGIVSKDEYAKALRAFKEARDEMTSDARTKAAES